MNSKPPKIDCKMCILPTSIPLNTRFFTARFNMKPILNLTLRSSKSKARSSITKQREYNYARSLTDLNIGIIGLGYLEL